MSPHDAPSPAIRAAVPDDVAGILQLIRELADYEREPDAVVATESDLRAALFGPDPSARALVAADATGELVALALYFRTFSTWTGRPGLYLEDLFVRPEQRGRGLGRSLLAELARIAVAQRYPRLEWAVLDWNSPAIGFYQSLGAAANQGWSTFRLSGEPLRRLAGTPESDV